MFHNPTITSIIGVKKTTAWGESGFPSEFLGPERCLIPTTSKLNPDTCAKRPGTALGIAIHSPGYGVLQNLFELLPGDVFQDGYQVGKGGHFEGVKQLYRPSGEHNLISDASAVL